MKFSYLVLIFICTVYLIGSCNDTIENKLEFRDYYAEGTADTNHLEKGVWKFFGLENHELCQLGSFTLGLRDGMWQYYFPIRDSIYWIPFNNNKLALRTNIPNFLILDFEDKGFISFKHQDTAKFLLLKIAYAKNVNFNPEDYNKLIRGEVIINSIQVKSDEYSLINTTCNKSYHFNRFKGVDTLHRPYELLTINTIIDSNLVEVTLRTEINNLNVGENVFYSVVTNLFIANSRFFDTNIDCEILLNKVVKRKRSFSFGCNKTRSN